MKHIYTFSFFFILVALSSHARLTSKVDERFELTSIVFRLVGAEEYVNNNIPHYAKDIDDYFTNYKEHELIQFSKEILRKRDYIAYNAIVSVANLLEIKKGKVTIKPETDIRTYLENDDRWKEDTLKKFVKLLNKFYKDTKFGHFFASHQQLYAEAEKNFNVLLEKVDTDWFTSFYGKPFGDPFIFIGLCNGRHNYALSFYDKQNIDNYGIIIGCTHTDSNELPVFDEYMVLPILIHEFAHRFTNPLIRKYEKELMPASEIMYPYLKEQLSKVGYGTPLAVHGEGFNNLFTNMYLNDHLFLFAKHSISKDERSGFVWMERAFHFMENYSRNKDLYLTIDDFMPQLIEFYNYTAQNIEYIMTEYTMKTPVVTSVYPAIIDGRIPADTKEIRIQFSRPMWNASANWYIDGETLTLPMVGPSSWSEDMRTLIVPLKDLEKGVSYGFRLPNGVFQSSTTHWMKEDFDIRFKVAD